MDSRFQIDYPPSESGIWNLELFLAAVPFQFVGGLPGELAFSLERGLPEQILDLPIDAAQFCRGPALQLGPEFRIYPQKKSFWDMLFELADVKAQNPLDVQARLQVYRRFFPAMAMPFAITCY